MPSKSTRLPSTYQTRILQQAYGTLEDQTIASLSTVPRRCRLTRLWYWSSAQRDIHLVGAHQLQSHQAMTDILQDHNRVSLSILSAQSFGLLSSPCTTLSPPLPLTHRFEPTLHKCLPLVTLDTWYTGNTFPGERKSSGHQLRRQENKP